MLDMSKTGFLIFDKDLLVGDIPRVDDFDALWRALVGLGYDDLAPQGQTQRIRVWIDSESNQILVNTVQAAPEYCPGVEVLPYLPAHLDVHLDPQAWAELIARGLRASRYLPEVSHE